MVGYFEVLFIQYQSQYLPFGINLKHGKVYKTQQLLHLSMLSSRHAFSQITNREFEKYNSKCLEKKFIIHSYMSSIF